MIALPAKFRIKVYNGTGATIAAHDITVKVCLQKFDNTGAVTESASTTLFDSASTLVAAGYEAGGWFDNATLKYIGFHGLCYTNTTGAPAGSIKIFLENSTDGTAAPSDGRGWTLAEIAHNAAGATTRPVKA
jgi:hypothetical protein